MVDQPGDWSPITRLTINSHLALATGPYPSSQDPQCGLSNLPFDKKLLAGLRTEADLARLDPVVVSNPEVDEPNEAGLAAARADSAAASSSTQPAKGAGAAAADKGARAQDRRFVGTASQLRKQASKTKDSDDDEASSEHGEEQGDQDAPAQPLPPAPKVAPKPRAASKARAAAPAPAPASDEEEANLQPEAVLGRCDLPPSSARWGGRRPAGGDAVPPGPSSDAPVRVSAASKPAASKKASKNELAKVQLDEMRVTQEVEYATASELFAVQ